MASLASRSWVPHGPGKTMKVQELMFRIDIWFRRRDRNCTLRRSIKILTAVRVGPVFGVRNHRIEGIEQQQTGKKAADMRLPGDFLTFFATDLHGAETE
jgi:hypothetical protein